MATKLTEFEKEMHQKLCEQGKIKWRETKHNETRALNRLIKKGFATYDPVLESWYPVLP